MQVFIFQSAHDPDLVAFATDSDPAKLPDAWSPWRPQGSARIGMADPESGSELVRDIATALDVRGYYIARASALGSPASGVSLARQ